jgi:hypothetical protein
VDKIFGITVYDESQQQDLNKARPIWPSTWKNSLFCRSREFLEVQHRESLLYAIPTPHQNYYDAQLRKSRRAARPNGLVIDECVVNKSRVQVVTLNPDSLDQFEHPYFEPKPVYRVLRPESLQNENHTLRLHVREEILEEPEANEEEIKTESDLCSSDEEYDYYNARDIYFHERTISTRSFRAQKQNIDIDEFIPSSSTMSISQARRNFLKQRKQREQREAEREYNQQQQAKLERRAKRRATSRNTLRHAAYNDERDWQEFAPSPWITASEPSLTPYTPQVIFCC